MSVPAAADVPDFVRFLPFPLWWLIPLALIVGAVGIALPKTSNARGARRKGSARAAGADAPRLFVAKKRLISKREMEFLRVLEPIARERGLRVCPQVRLEDVIESDQRAANRYGTRQTIRGMHLDFVLVETETFLIRAGVELQDSTHSAKRRRTADETKARAMESAGVPLLIFGSASELRRQGLGAVQAKIVASQADG